MLLTKKNTILLDEIYAHPNTSTLLFEFGSKSIAATEERLRSAAIQHGLIDGKDLYIIDGFFSAAEGKEMEDFSATASFSRYSYGSPQAIERGEKPALSMNGKERWQFFAKPQGATRQVYNLFSTLSHQLNAEITTLPWELCDGSAHGSPAVIANKLSIATSESEEAGKHQDYNPAKKISFGIPVLYQEPLGYHPSSFINGDSGKPWLISAMVYTTAPEFLPHMSLGTVFYNDRGNAVLTADCRNMRLILFQGDIFHSIEKSTFLVGESAWRVSYVFKLIVNPKEASKSMKENCLSWMKTLNHLLPIQLGPCSRA